MCIRDSTIIDMMVHVAQQSAEGMAYNRITDAFNSSDAAKENKIKIRVDYSPRSNSATGYETELGNMLNNGTLPDIKMCIRDSISVTQKARWRNLPACRAGSPQRANFT